MIIAYHRPTTIAEALELLSRSEPETVPLGGGTVLSRPGPGRNAVVDLQALGLDGIERQENHLVIGAAATLQSLYGHPELPAALKEAIRRETTYNLRQTASVAGALVTADGKSSFAVAMLALGAELEWAPDGRKMGLEEYYAIRGTGKTPKSGLILRVAIPFNADLQYEAVAKTPADVPMICGAVSQAADGVLRVVVGGFGVSPAVFTEKNSGSETSSTATAAIEAINNAYSQYSNQISSHSDYFQTTIATLIQRLMQGRAGRGE